jgi:hypothetical protein
MNFFKRSNKTEKPSGVGIAINELRSFRGIGEKFNYLGVEMTVYSHFEYIPMFGIIPELKANYVTKNGEIKNACFGYSELPILRKENS